MLTYIGMKQQHAVKTDRVGCRGWEGGGVTFTGLVLIARGPQQGWAAVVL